jgi:DnaK suppressor protein
MTLTAPEIEGQAMAQTQARCASPILSEEDCEDLRKKLLAERQRLREEYRHDLGAAQAIEVERGEDFEDLAAIEVDRDRLFSHSEQDRETLFQIEEALQRMDEGTYGLDLRTGEAIPVERLRLIPWARYRTSVQEKVESGKLPET